MAGKPNVYSHAETDVTYESRLQVVRTNVEGVTDPVEKEAQRLALANLESSTLGRDLIRHQGLNGALTQLFVLYPHYSVRCQDFFPSGQSMTPYDREMLTTFPVVMATQERFDIFQRALNAHTHATGRVASVPCGFMDDLLTLDFTVPFTGRFYGFDVDRDSLEGAVANARSCGKEDQVEFAEADAWELGVENKFDVLTSNGLNIYVGDEARVVALYSSFHRALKPGGVLITSALTPPPTVSPESEWDMGQVNISHLQAQKRVFVDVVGVKWNHFRTSSQTINQLKSAGFTDVEVTWDRQRMFPTFVAK